MNIVIYDTNEKNRALLYGYVKEIQPWARVDTFSAAEELRLFAKKEQIQVAFINIDEAGGNGYFLGEEFRKSYPRMNLIFISEQSRNIQGTMKLRASGYLNHIPTREEIQEELAELRYKENSSIAKA